MAQILAVIIFVAMFALIVTEKIERHIVTLVCGLLVLVLVFGLVMHSPAAIWETLNLRAIFTLSFWYPAGQGGEASAGLGDNRIPCRHDDHGRRNGKCRILPLVMHADCKGC